MIQPDELKKDKPLAVVARPRHRCLGNVLRVRRGRPGGRRAAGGRTIRRSCAASTRTARRCTLRCAKIEFAVVDFLLEHGADPLSLAVNDSLLDICRDRGYAEMEQLLEANFASIQGASPAGEAVAAAIREHDLAKVRTLARRVARACCTSATSGRISRSIGPR